MIPELCLFFLLINSSVFFGILEEFIFSVYFQRMKTLEVHIDLTTKYSELKKKYDALLGRAKKAEEEVTLYRSLSTAPRSISTAPRSISTAPRSISTVPGNALCFESPPEFDLLGSFNDDGSETVFSLGREKGRLLKNLL